MAANHHLLSQRKEKQKVTGTFPLLTAQNLPKDKKRSV